MQNLNAINFSLYSGENLTQMDEIFILKMLRNSKETLQTLCTSNFIIPDINFPKLSTLELIIGEKYISLHEFQMYFSRVLRNMENLETVYLDLLDDDTNVCEYIAKNYAKHCISASRVEYTLNCVGVKILTNGQLFELENQKYGHNLQYLHVWIPTHHPMAFEWDRYRDILDQYTNLKVIELRCQYHNLVIVDILPSLSNDIQQIWKERISYFKARGIRLANINEIYGNENLKIKLAKEQGITWKFHFH